MAGQVVYKRTNIEGVLTLTYNDGDFTLKYIIDADMYNKLPRMWGLSTKNYSISRHTTRLVCYIINNGKPLGDTFINYRNGNKFDLRRENLELIQKNIYCVDPNNPDITLLHIQSSINAAGSTIVRIDTKFAEKISKYLWRVKDDNYIHSSGRNNTGCHKLHHMVFCLAGGKIDLDLVIDHIDRNKLNNCAINLRQVTVTVNNRNRNFKRRSSSGVIGVYKHHNTWAVSIPNIDIPGKSIQFEYSINTYGYDGALELAIKKRKDWETKLGITSELID